MRGWQDRGAARRALVLVLVLAALWSGAVQAGPFSCAIASVSGISLSYNPNASNALVGSGTVTVNCSKTGGNTATRHLEVGAGTGLNATGGQNRAGHGAGGRPGPAGRVCGAGGGRKHRGSP